MSARRLAGKSAEVVNMRLRPDCGSKTVTGDTVGDASVLPNVAAPDDRAAAVDEEADGRDEPLIARK